MNELVVADKASEWLRLKALVLDSISSPITRRVYNLGLDEFIAWYTEEPRIFSAAGKTRGGTLHSRGIWRRGLSILDIFGIGKTW